MLPSPSFWPSCSFSGRNTRVCMRCVVSYYSYCSQLNLIIHSIVFSISFYRGPPTSLLVTVSPSSVFCLPKRFFPVSRGPSLPTCKILPSFSWQASYSKWSLAPEQIVKLLRIFTVLNAGVLGPLGSLRSASCQQPQLSCLCNYSASFKLLLLWLRSRCPSIASGGHVTLLVSSHQQATRFHRKFWNLPNGDCHIRNLRSRQ